MDLIGTSTVARTRITNNTTLVVSPNGVAQASGGAFLAGSASPKRITDSVIRGNRAEARSTTGFASLIGAAIANDGNLELRNVQLSDNAGVVSAPTGFAYGGGIWNGDLFWGGPRSLSLWNTSVTRNSLTGSSPGITLLGAGLYTPDYSVSLNDSRVTGNTPALDQCVGC